MRARSRNPRRRSGRINFSALALIAIGAGAMAAFAVLISGIGYQTMAPPLPEGWQIIRPPDEVCALAVDGETIWAGGRDGLFCIRRKTGELQVPRHGRPVMSYVRALLTDGKGRLWVAHLEGLSCLEAGHWRTWPVGKDGLGARPLSLVEDPDGTLRVGTERGLVRFEEGRFIAVQIPTGLGVTAVDVLYRDRDGVLWLGCASPTRGGLFSCDGRNWRAYGHADGLVHLSVNAILQSRDGTLWVATGFQNQGGASRRAGEKFETWTKKDGLAGEKVRSIFEDRAGRIWFGSEYDGVAVLEGSTWRVISLLMGLAGREVKVVVQDTEGVYWLGTDGGLSRIENWQPVESAEDAP